MLISSNEESRRRWNIVPAAELNPELHRVVWSESDGVPG